MKRIFLVLVLCVMAVSLPAQERDLGGFHPGIQLDSDGVVSIVARLGFLEAALKAQGMLYDTPEGEATPNQWLFGAHVVYLFGDAAEPRRFGAGVDIRTAIGTDDVEYDVYVDAAPRLSVDQFLGNRVYVTGVLFPLWLEARDVSDVEDDGQLVVTIPRAAVAVTLLF